MEIIWIVVAFIAGLVAKTLKLPTLVGFLVAGLVLTLFGVSSTTLLSELGEAGVILLLFSVGLHLRAKSLVKPEVLGVGGVHLALTAIVFGVAGIALGLDPIAAAIIAIGLGFSSTVLTAKTLESRKELDSYSGRIAIGILILQDVVAIVLLALMGSKSLSWMTLGLLALPLARPLLARLLKMVGNEELLVLFGVFMAFGVAYLFQLLGLSPELGALVAGLLLTGSREAKLLDKRLWSLKELFLVGFFLDVGLTGLPSFRGALVAVALALALPIKEFLFFVLFTRFNLRARTSFMTALTLTTYSEFALIVGNEAAAVGVIPPDAVSVVALAVVFSFLANAPLTRTANTLWIRLQPTLSGFERDVKHPDHQPSLLGHTDYLVIGMGQAGTAAYNYLIEHQARPLGLDDDPARIENHLQTGRRVAYGDAQDPDLWDNLDLSEIKAVMLAIPAANAKLITTQLLRDRGYTGPIRALVRQGEGTQALQEAGINSLTLPLTEAGRSLAALSLADQGELHSDVSV